MGLDFNGARFLLYAHRLGISFEQTAMIGRQSLDLTKAELSKSLADFGYGIDDELINKIFTKDRGYAEPLLSYLGAQEIHSFDFSTYEGATHLHDMNRDISPQFMEKYSVVLDGGSLEHVFNFPVAIRNCMQMLRMGGHYLGISPANNFMGHGFYQFSPELYFSVFNQENGFELIGLIAFEDRPGGTWFSVRNPKEVKGRVMLVNNEPVYLLIVARRHTKTAIFDSTPQQSDYIATWDPDKKLSELTPSNLPQEGKRISLRNWLKSRLPFPIRYLIQRTIQGDGFNHRFFSPMKPTAVKRLHEGYQQNAEP